MARLLCPGKQPKKDRCRACNSRITRPADGSINELYCGEICRNSSDGQVIEVAHRG